MGDPTIADKDFTNSIRATPEYRHFSFVSTFLQKDIVDWRFVVLEMPLQIAKYIKNKKFNAN